MGSEDLHPLDDPLGHGVRLFNEEYFFEAHEHLEAIWTRDTTPSRKFYQGLIQIASGYHHFQNGNARGAADLLQRGSDRLRPYAPSHAGVDVGSLLTAVEQHIETISRMRADPTFDVVLEFPKIRYESLI